MAAIYDLDGNEITSGLQGSNVSDQARHAAKRIARERSAQVLLVDDDGEWIVCPSGDVILKNRAPIPTDDWESWHEEIEP